MRISTIESLDLVVLPYNKCIVSGHYSGLSEFCSSDVELIVSESYEDRGKRYELSHLGTMAEVWRSTISNLQFTLQALMFYPDGNHAQETFAAHYWVDGFHKNSNLGKPFHLSFTDDVVVDNRGLITWVRRIVNDGE